MVTHKPSGKSYIGKKVLFHNKKQKIGKRELEKLQGVVGRRPAYKLVVKESDWKTYYGSQTDIKQLLLEDIIKLELQKLGLIKEEEMSLEVGALPNYTNEPTGKLVVNREATYGFASIDEKQILVGPAMVPGKLIPRKDENGDLYYVYFTKDTIKKLAYKAMKDKIIDRVNIEHNSGELIDDVGQYSISMKILFPTLFRGKDFVLFSAFFRY